MELSYKKQSFYCTSAVGIEHLEQKLKQNNSLSFKLNFFRREKIANTRIKRSDKCKCLLAVFYSDNSGEIIEHGGEQRLDATASTPTTLTRKGSENKQEVHLETAKQVRKSAEI
jgi:hypothetical protein